MTLYTAGKEPKNNQIIEGTYGHAYFKITKEKHHDLVFYIVRVSGPSEDARLSITSQFKILLLDIEPIEFSAGVLLNTDSLFWSAKAILGEK